MRQALKICEANPGSGTCLAVRRLGLMVVSTSSGRTCTRGARASPSHAMPAGEPRIVLDCVRAATPEAGPVLSQGGPAATHLVTIASDNPELVCVGLGAFQPSRCLILYTRGKQAMLEQITSMCGQKRTECEVVPMAFESADELLIQMGAAVEQFTRGADPESTVLDLTPGTKEMSMALAFDVAKPGNRLIYLRHGRQGLKVVPFSEELRVWQVRSGTRRFG